MAPTPATEALDHSARGRERSRSLAFFGKLALLTVCLMGMTLAPRADREGEANRGWTPMPTAHVMLLAFAGSRIAAASTAWILTLQRIGDGHFIAAGVPGLERAAHTVIDLAPEFQTPYAFVGLTLLAYGRDDDAPDRILARGIGTLGGGYELWLYRALVAYFRKGDIKQTLLFVRQATEKEGAPTYLTRWANTLESEGIHCEDLQGLPGDQQQSPLLLLCTERELERAAAACRIRLDRDCAGLKEMRELGLLKGKTYTPPGQCWTFVGPNAILESCFHQANP